ncbi:MAG TPA: Z1 domain-containing protein [Kiritimatiellia bacterium]|nr:Z1 domain-containing protein [Kiritimatiellia bacterium]HMO99747.1 Z1 domain-containing protein [Kiritimatiellia bacterium]HMP00018.1 Z1 domain-containing protein [Kiritimatiellia bacterium]HMP97316.1 Z1 domain-containing protein [Kiritimatiellia bacterium]
MTAEQQRALRTARSLLDLGYHLNLIFDSQLIPAEHREFIRAELHKDENITLSPARTLVADPNRPDWLRNRDRSTWYYWPTLRQYLLTTKGWSAEALRSLDDSSDRILRQLGEPSQDHFDVRGLVLGFVQSGKTANYTAVIAKAADAGYRLIIVLSGIDNGLRRQTNVRLKRELVGYPDNRAGAVRLPPMGRHWHEFTREDLNGDFQAGAANHASLQGSQPVLLVVKKNGAVLRRLLHWLDGAPPEVRRTLPMMVIDDEADQASVDTRGTYQVDDDPLPPDYEPPSVINLLIRDLLRRFERRVYVAYTATPFANILIPHDTSDPRVGNDLYPKDFIVDLPKPAGYFGAEEIFGRMDGTTGMQAGGLDIIREVSDHDIVDLGNGQLPRTLEVALLDFVLAGAARAQRGQGNAPATMLIHTSQRILVQAHLRALVSGRFAELRDEWRYQREHSIRARLSERWESEFRPVTRASHLDRDVEFSEIAPHIGPFFEAVQVREVNSLAGEVLDYEREPSLKAIAVGGNRLSRGLTLEGLLVSFFIRPSATYDTLMQMGRWFGFRADYEDLTRIWTPPTLAGWFSDLAFVEHRLREDIGIYESQRLTPLQVGMRIWQHPTMQVTSPLKRRFASATTISQSYSLSLEQTFKFPLRRLQDLSVQAEANRLAVCDFASRLGAENAAHTDGKGPVWIGVSADLVLEFLREYRVDHLDARNISIPLICDYIERLRDVGELTNWTVAVRGRESLDATLRATDWGLPGGPVAQISRSRIGLTDSVGVITGSGDEAVGLSQELRNHADALIGAALAEGKTKSENSAAREVRPATNGLLLLFPISRYSGGGSTEGGRRPLYDDPDGPLARDLVGLALSFPRSNQPQTVEAFIQGSVGWRPLE